MKIYPYDELRKLNQALGSFKKNGVAVVDVKLLAIGDKVQYFILADPAYTPKPKPVESKLVKKEKKVEEKAEVEKKETEKKEEEKKTK